MNPKSSELKIQSSKEARIFGSMRRKRPERGQIAIGILNLELILNFEL
jgi:hypothetical protein